MVCVELPWLVLFSVACGGFSLSVACLCLFCIIGNLQFVVLDFLVALVCVCCVSLVVWAVLVTSVCAPVLG